MLAAGYAPPYPQTPLEDGAMASVREAIERPLDGPDPHPVGVPDRVSSAKTADSQQVSHHRSPPPSTSASIPASSPLAAGSKVGRRTRPIIRLSRARGAMRPASVKRA